MLAIMKVEHDIRSEVRDISISLSTKEFSELGRSLVEAGTAILRVGGSGCVFHFILNDRGEVNVRAEGAATNVPPFSVAPQGPQNFRAGPPDRPLGGCCETPPKRDLAGLIEEAKLVLAERLIKAATNGNVAEVGTALVDLIAITNPQ